MARFSRRTRTLAIGATVVFALLASGCVDKRITVPFDSQSIGAPLNPLNKGSSSLFTTIEVASLNGGQIIGAPGLVGSGSGGDFPDHDPSSDGPRAVLRISNTANFELLNPTDRDFWFGADVNLDPVSASPDTNDDGNNVIQRGLYNSPSQYKIQIDDDKPSCRLKGPVADQFLGGNPIVPGQDYRIRCERIGQELRLRVWSLNADATLGPLVTDNIKAVDIGSLVFANTVPVSVGGKLRNDGSIDPSTDQFNGTIDNAFLRIDFPEIELPPS